MMKRCSWARTDLSILYHDKEWGVPVHDDRVLFEFLTLEGAQAGLSWETVLKKREGYRLAFDDFDPIKIAKYDERKLARLLGDPEIIRNRLKLASTVENARSFLRIQKEFGTFESFIWQFVAGQPRRNRWRSPDQVPSSTPESLLMSRSLKHRGFKFVGTTICYAFMQAVGMVNDHTLDCFRYGI